jgi:serine/threonine protein phosphatase PrpC
MSFVSNILDKFGISATLIQADDFEKWLVNEAWKKYTEERMNNRIIIENRVKSECNLRVPNGTVRKEYLAQIELPLELVEDAWFDGSVETLGLTWNLETDAVVMPVASSDTTEVTDESAVVETANGLDDSESVKVKNDIEAESGTKPTKLILKITGKPSEAGDSTITLRYKYKGWMDGEPISTVNIPIAFNPDPRSLWKNTPTSKDIPFYKPDFECEYVKVESGEDGTPRKDIVAASQRGRSHAQEGKARDDHFKVIHCDESDWYIIAVADGAGSAKLSRRGSEIACNTVVDHCLEQLKNYSEFEAKIRAYHEAKEDENARREMSTTIYNIVGGGAFKAHKAIKAAADANESVTAKDFATTLMFAICKKFDFGWFIASYWVGDGAMCLYNREKGTHKLLGIPDEGEFSGQTRFLTMQEIFKDAKSVMDRLRFSIEDDFTALMLMTDGVSDPMFETDNNLNSTEKWDEFWDKLHDGFKDDEIPGVDLSDDNEESKYQLLHWLDFWSPGNHDDRTIAILY